MATASHIISSSSLTFPSPQTPSILPQSPFFIKLHTHATSSTKLPVHLFTITPPPTHITQVNAVLSTSNNLPPASSSSSTSTTTNSFYGVCYVVRDDVDTDQILLTEYSSLNPSNTDEGYNKVGSFAKSYPLRYVEINGVKSKYSIIIAGNNFGCGSSCEHATAALTDAGTLAVVAKSYDGVFLKKKSNSRGKILALESELRICDEVKTGDVATIDVEERILVNQTTGKIYQLKGFC